jgi:RNA polymerase sigma factor (sigma-70 family)
MEDPVDLIEAKTVHLIRRAQEGDGAALETLFQRYAPRAKQIAALRMRRPVSSLATLDDIVQEALLRAFRNLEHFEQRTEGSFRHYLACCVQTAIGDALDKAHNTVRDEKREVQVADMDLFAEIFGRSAVPTASGIVQARELLERTEAALASLSDRDQYLIVLGRLDRMSSAEIARHLGFEKEETVRVALSRALKKLESALGIG